MDSARPVKDTVPPFLRLSARLGWPLGPADSRPGVPHNDANDRSGGGNRPLALAVAGRSAIPMAEPFGSFGGQTLPRGVAITGDGRMLVADPARRVILSTLAGTIGNENNGGALAPFAPLWPARPWLPAQSPVGADCTGDNPAIPDDPYTLVEPVDVALSPRGDLAILDRGAMRILVLALPSALLRQLIPIDSGTPSGTPEAIAYDNRGNLYLALGNPGALHRYDRNGRRDPDFPRISLRQPVALAAARTPVPPGPSGCQSPPSAAATMHVVDAGKLISLDARGFAVPAGKETLDLAVPPLSHADGGALGWPDPETPGYTPMLFHGITLDMMGRHRGSGRPVMTLPRRIEVPRIGRFITTALDSGVSGFQWDRLAFDLELPANAKVIVSTLTSDVETAFDRLQSIPNDRWSPPLALLPGDLPEVMVQSRPGRFLWLKVEMSGDGTTSPRIHEIDIFGPRRSSLRHLPAPFRDDPESAHFLDRFLSYFDTVFAEIIARHRSLAQLFDPRIVPADFLSWLGSWFDLEFLASWPEATRRQMIAEAIPHFRQRGTVRGLKRMLQWHTGLQDPLPQVIEHFRLSEGQPVRIGGADLAAGTRAHRFTIVMPAHLAGSDRERSMLERLIQASIPAHTRYDLRLTEPGVTIACQSTIGVDMVLGSAGGGALGAGRLGTTFSTGPARPDAMVHLSQSLTANPDKGTSPCQTCQTRT